MLIERRSMITGKVTQRDLPVTDEQMRRFNSGEGYIQEIFSNLSPGDREFIKTGITEAEWNAVFDAIDDE